MSLLGRALLGWMCAGTLSLWGQTEIGGAGLNGTVTDPSGAVVANAKVSVKSPATGLSRTAETNGSGLYSLRLPVGVYDVSIEATGFRTSDVKGIQLAVGSALTLDIVLQVGGATERVDVSAEAPAVETTRTSTSTNVNAKAVAD